MNLKQIKAKFIPSNYKRNLVSKRPKSKSRSRSKSRKRRPNVLKNKTASGYRPNVNSSRRNTNRLRQNTFKNPNNGRFGDFIIDLFN
jgi:hypothetical protein